MRTVYIASLSRSGSTFLQLLLSSHPEIVGLGEIAHVIKTGGVPTARQAAGGSDGSCTCGHPAADCEFWAPLMPEMAQSDEHALHRNILARFKEQFPDKLLLDSSKSEKQFAKYYLQPDSGAGDLRVIFLIRDFRGWVRSVQKHVRKTPGGSFIYRSYLATSYLWYLKNRSIMQMLRRSGVSFLCVSYENLVFHLDEEVERILRFLDVGQVPPGDLDLGKAVMHELFGSPTIRSSTRHRSQVVYDQSWFCDLRYVVRSPLMLPVLHFNHQVHTKLAKDRHKSGPASGMPVCQESCASRPASSASDSCTDTKTSPVALAECGRAVAKD